MCKWKAIESLVRPVKPTVLFSMKENKLQVIQDVIKKAIRRSALGPNAIPCKVYKRYPQIVSCGS